MRPGAQFVIRGTRVTSGEPPPDIQRLPRLKQALDPEFWAEFIAENHDQIDDMGSPKDYR
jgi:hypothetical protein